MPSAVDVRGEEKIVTMGAPVFHVGLERIVLGRHGRRGRGVRD